MTFVFEIDLSHCKLIILFLFLFYCNTVGEISFMYYTRTYTKEIIENLYS